MSAEDKVREAARLRTERFMKAHAKLPNRIKGLLSPSEINPNTIYSNKVLVTCVLLTLRILDMITEEDKEVLRAVYFETYDEICKEENDVSEQKK